jgi:hypothetical protein
LRAQVRKAQGPSTDSAMPTGSGQEDGALTKL